MRPENFSRWLGVLMLSMGLTLSPRALLRAVQQPKAGEGGHADFV
jgi:predicted Na+-dependent transporter